MSFVLIAMYVIYIVVGLCLKLTSVRIYINNYKIFSDELYEFFSNVLLIIGAGGVIAYFVLAAN